MTVQYMYLYLKGVLSTTFSFMPYFQFGNSIFAKTGRWSEI